MLLNLKQDLLRYLWQKSPTMFSSVYRKKCYKNKWAEHRPLETSYHVYIHRFFSLWVHIQAVTNPHNWAIFPAVLPSLVYRDMRPLSQHLIAMQIHTLIYQPRDDIQKVTWAPCSFCVNLYGQLMAATFLAMPKCGHKHFRVPVMCKSLWLLPGRQPNPYLQGIPVVVST